MHTTQTDNNNEVFIVVDTSIVQQIAEANLDRQLTKEELSRFEDVLISEGLSEIDDFIFRCIWMAVEDVTNPDKVTSTSKLSILTKSGSGGRF
jgi:hypothetical protein